MLSGFNMSIDRQSVRVWTRTSRYKVQNTWVEDD